MATSETAATLTEGHRLAQLQLGARTVQLMESAWRVLNPEALDATVADWLRITVPIVQRQQRLSAKLASQYVQAFRAIELGVDPTYLAATIVDNDLRAIITSLTVTGPVSIKEQMRRSVPLGRAVEVARSGSAGAALRHALAGGRGTIVGAVRSDVRALGWARVVSAKPCAFCAMLASRGPVYGKNSVNFRAHDRCTCSGEPVYDRDASWPPGSRAYRELWDEATRGLSGNDAINAFRNALGAA